MGGNVMEISIIKSSNGNLVTRLVDRHKQLYEEKIIVNHCDDEIKKAQLEIDRLKDKIYNVNLIKYQAKEMQIVCDSHYEAKQKLKKTENKNIEKKTKTHYIKNSLGGIEDTMCGLIYGYNSGKTTKEQNNVTCKSCIKLMSVEGTSDGANTTCFEATLVNATASYA